MERKALARKDGELLGVLALDIYLGETTEVPGLPLSLMGLVTQPYQCPRVGHIWEVQFILSKLRYRKWEQCCLFTRRNRTVRQTSPSF